MRSINAYLQQPMERIQKYKAILKVTDLTRNVLEILCSERNASLCLCKSLKCLPQHLQELIRNKAKNGQNCCLLEEAYAMVSALPQRSENTHHVSMIENYPATLEVLGEPIRQVGGLSRVFQHPWVEAWLWLFICVHFVFSGTLSSVGRGSRY